MIFQNTLYSNQKSPKLIKTNEPLSSELDDPLPSEEDLNDIKYPILEKLSIFKNIVNNRDYKKDAKTPKKDDLLAKKQIFPEHDVSIKHTERKIEKKDQAKPPVERFDHKSKFENKLPEFKPTLPDIFHNKDLDIKLSDGYVTGLRKYDPELFQDYIYNDENLYNDYIQSDSLTSYLIEKIRELHDWVTSDSDFYSPNSSKNSPNEFSQLLTALNDSIVEGNVSIVMTKLRDIYYGENYTISDKKMVLTNRTDLLSFGVLTLDIILLHNIQLMAWESQVIGNLLH